MRLYCFQEMCATGIMMTLAFKLSSRMNRTKPVRDLRHACQFCVRFSICYLTLKFSFTINWLKPVRNSKDAWQFCAAFNRCAFLLPACTF